MLQHALIVQTLLVLKSTGNGKLRRKTERVASARTALSPHKSFGLDSKCD